MGDNNLVGFSFHKKLISPLTLSNDPDRMDDTGDVAKKGQENVQPKSTANAHLKKDT